MAAVVTQEAAKNPGRLFKIIKKNGKPVSPEQEFAVRLIKGLLNAAATDLRARGRSHGSVLFGETLRVVIEETVVTAAGNVELAVSNETALIQLVNRINKLQGNRATGFGRNEWLQIFRKYLKLVLLSEDGQAVIKGLSDADIKKHILPTDSP